MNVDQRLAALHSALDDVLDLDRGLADAVLPRAHADLVTGLGNALDLEAGLAQVVYRAPGLPPRELDGFIAFADQLSTLPAAERLAARAWLPMSVLFEVYFLTTHIRTVRTLADELHDTECSIDIRVSARMDTQSLIRALDRRGLQSTEIHRVAHLLLDSLRSTQAPQLARDHSLHLRERFAERLAAMLAEIDRSTRHVHSSLVDAAFADALLEPLDKLMSALTNVIGADLTSANLVGVPLEGVRWSQETLWPADWETWVRANSVPVYANVFEIRPGKAGSWLTI